MREMKMEAMERGRERCERSDSAGEADGAGEADDYHP
jgi:hypothetical protein